MDLDIITNEGILPLTNLSHFGKMLLALDIIITFLLYKCKDTSVSRLISNIAKTEKNNIISLLHTDKDILSRKLSTVKPV